MAVAVRRLARGEVAALFDDLARLRIAVFRDWPYLYDGDMEYERRYLETYLQAPGAFVCGAFDGERLVGAATASPLAQHKAEFAEPFSGLGLDVDDFFYFGESVLLPGYRGQGVGVRFFDEREAEARNQGFSRCIFSAVIRPSDHPMRQQDYVLLDAFWRNRGYERIEGLTTAYSWKDLGDDKETDKPMQYWMRVLHR
ncbi:MAG: GNAT family N-acetyltransferase [Oricola sp.]